jgi:hypothetical protein
VFEVQASRATLHPQQLVGIRGAERLLRESFELFQGARRRLDVVAQQQGPLIADFRRDDVPSERAPGRCERVARAAAPRAVGARPSRERGRDLPT